MDYVKGCDINTLSKFSLKRIANGKLKIIESLQDTLTYDSLSAMLTEAKTDYVNSDGKTIKDMPTAEIFYMTKKIDGQKYIIGLSYIKRIAGEPSGNTGVKAWFEASRDKLVEDRRIFAEGFEKEEEYFNGSMIGHFRSSVGSGSAGSAEYADKVITRVKSRKLLGITLSTTAIFILMIIVWGLLFKNIGLGICFALCFTSCFTIVISKGQTEEKDIDKE